MAAKNYNQLNDGEKVKARAGSYASTYQRRGRLTPASCERCGEKAQKHHSDYSKPLLVQWLCRKCHTAFHVVANAAAKAELSSKCGDLLRELFAQNTRI